MNSQQGMFWTAGEDNNVRCGLCPHRCLIAENEAGRCGVRENQGGKLIASSYGMVSSVALDPIEKKPLNMFFPGKSILSIGGIGCNLRCAFCQNHEISTLGVRQGVGLTIVNDKLQNLTHRTGRAEKRLSPDDIVRLAVQAEPEGNIGVAYTYNEPLIGYEFLRDCAGLVREAGLKNVIVTNGYINKEPLAALLPLVDAMNIDLKGFTEGFYNKLGGTLGPVMETIALSHKSCHVEVTTLVVPEENESDIEDLAGWLSSISRDIPLHLSRFFPRYRYSDAKPTPRETILKLCEIAKKHLKYVFAGNM